MVFFKEDAEDLYQNAPFGYLTINAHGLIVNANKTLLQWLHFEREDLIHSKTLMELLGVGDRIFYETHLVPLLQMNGEIAEVNVTIKGGQNKSFPALINGKRISNFEDASLYYRFCILNISQRKQFEMELLEERKKVEQALIRLKEVNEKLEQFAYIASHDLQAPLNTIIGMFSLLERKGYITPEFEQTQYYQFIRLNITKMKQLISGLLEFSKIDSAEIQLETVDLNKVCQEAIQSLHAEIQKNEAQFKLQDLPQVNGERMLLFRLFQNLFSNALKFRSEEPPEIHVSCDIKDDELYIRVSDNGIGIDPKQSEQIFGFMKRLHTYDAIPGTGIGLAACKRIVEMHGGTIGVESAPNQGSTFFFTLKR
jgi:signal transduction histidine kinase